MKFHSFLISIIIVQVIFIIYMIYQENETLKARQNRTAQLLEQTCRLIEDGHAKEAGKVLMDTPITRHITDSFDYLDTAFAEIQNNEQAEPQDAEKKSEQAPAETVPATEGGEQP